MLFFGQKLFSFHCFVVVVVLFIVQNVTALEEENSLLKEKIRSFEESSVSFD